MPEEMPPQYDHAATERKIYEQWEQSGYFNPDNLPDQSGVPYTIVLPPPNVTGTLHVGHALMLVIQDILIRWRRMQGRRTLWLPGTDHAAIATQSKVEALIYKEEGKNRHDLGREEFLRRVEAYAQASHDTIMNQVRRMGASIDWSREAYTLDAARNVAVRTAFKRMYDAGLIYRGARMVNWDPKMQTTVSDDEIEWKDEITSLYYLKYGPFTIATARPETKFGDKYVVMHPDDPRYAHYTDGQKIDLEWINGPVTATVIKDAAIDMDFGTGVMTITPWHDATDFDIAERHGLDKEQVIDERGLLLPIAGEFAGQHIKKARPLIVEKLKQKGLLVKVDEGYAHRVATNSRGGGMIEPQIKEQWFVDVNKEFAIPHSELKGIQAGDRVTLKQLMRHVVESGEIKILPEHFVKTYYHWIDNLRDWCISRQIWYGHRVPVWYCLGCGTVKVDAPVKSRWFLVRHGETEENKNKKIYARATDLETPLNEEGLAQAETAAQAFKNQKVDLIISSHYVRARQTAEAIARVTGAKVVLDERLRERNFGDAHGMSITELKENFPTFYGYDDKSAHQENYQDLEQRMWEAFSEHYQNHSDKNVVLVGHGGAFRAFVRRIRNVDPSHIIKGIPALENARPAAFDMLEPCTTCGGHFYEQDPDTLDTWFSSGLWTFSTLGWPQDTHDLRTFHPTDVLETGYDILFFWVARMVLMTTYLLGQIPFRHVYLHGLVRDKDRQKMSKSKGNIVDPLGIIDTYGTDALRFAMIFSTAAGNDIPLAEDKVKGMKHFANKIWNIARFVLTNAGAETSAKNRPVMAPAAKTEADRAIMEELAAASQDMTAGLEAFELHQAAQKIYDFIWYKFADVYIETSKKQLADPALKDSTATLLRYILESSLALLHPFMPFVTEEIYQKIKPGKLLMIAAWPSGGARKV